MEHWPHASKYRLQRFCSSTVTRFTYKSRICLQIIFCAWPDIMRTTLFPSASFAVVVGRSLGRVLSRFSCSSCPMERLMPLPLRYSLLIYSAISRYGRELLRMVISQVEMCSVWPSCLPSNYSSLGLALFLVLFSCFLLIVSSGSSPLVFIVTRRIDCWVR